MPLNRTTSGDAATRVLVLIPTERPHAPSSEQSGSRHDGDEAAHLRAQLDEALEEVAFLGEQLRATEAWSAHHIATLQARHRMAREAFLRDLALLVEGLDQHALVLDAIDESERSRTHDADAARADRVESAR